MTSRVEATTSWRAVCPNFGQDGHTTHVLSKDTFEEVEAVVAANDHLYEQLAKGADDLFPYYRDEVGWRVQKQIVSDWENV